MAVTIELSPELEARLRREAAREGLPPEAYVARALEEHLRNGGPQGGNGSGNGPAATSLSAEESDLLRQINLGLPPDFWSDYRRLLRRRDEGALTPDEQAALITMSDRVEEANARRMTHVSSLARLRGVTLDSLMRTLGIAGEPRG